MPRRVIASGLSCHECRRRKIKCDRAFPCSYCVKTRIQCAHPQRRTGHAAIQRSEPSEADILARVEGIESTLSSLGQGLSEIRQFLQIDSQSHIPDGDVAEDGLAGDHNERMSSDYSGSLDGQQMQNELEESISITPFPKPTKSPRPLDDINNKSSSPFKVDPSINLASLHPSPGTIFFLWHTYLENVDPLLKIFHTRDIERHLVNVSRGKPVDCPCEQSVVFAIYYAAVLSLSEEECRNELGEEKSTLTKRYRHGVEQSLVRGDFLNLCIFLDLQVFVLYLICCRRDEQGPDVRKLMGLVIDIAVEQQIHKERLVQMNGPSTGQVCRRLWWHICTLDVQTAEDHGSDPLIMESSFDTRFPADIYDGALGSTDCTGIVEQPGKSDMLFCLVRFEVGYFARRIIFSDEFCRQNGYPVLSQSERRKAIDEFSQIIEKKYLCHCDEVIPLDFVVVASTRMVLMKLKLTSGRPILGDENNITIPVDLRQVCVEILKNFNSWHRNKKRRMSLWLYQTHIEWDALAFLLVDLCVAPSASDQRAWEVANTTYHHERNHGEIPESRRWENIENLWSEVMMARDKAAYQTQGIDDVDILLSANPSIPSPTLVIASETVLKENQAVTSDEAMEMPGAGTACEWSAGLFQRYFEVVGDESNSTSLL